MGAVALSKADEEALKELQETLDLPSKAQVIHRALEELQRIVTREILAEKIRESVRKCASADLKEHQALSGGAYLLSETE